MSKIFDNRFWYIGYTATQLGDRDYDKALCFIVRNPFDRSWKHWEEVKRRGAEARERKADIEAAMRRYNIPVGVDPDKAHLFDSDVKVLKKNNLEWDHGWDEYLWEARKGDHYFSIFYYDFLGEYEAEVSDRKASFDTLEKAMRWCDEQELD